MVKFDLYVAYHPKNGLVGAAGELSPLMRQVKVDYCANEVTVIKMTVKDGAVADNAVLPLDAYEYA